MVESRRISGAVEQDPSNVHKQVETQCFLGLYSDLTFGSCFGSSGRRDMTFKLPGNNWLLVIDDQPNSVHEGRHSPCVNPRARKPMTRYHSHE